MLSQHYAEPVVKVPPFLSPLVKTEPEFLNFQEAYFRIQGINSAGLCSLAGRYDSPHRLFKNSSTGSLFVPFCGEELKNCGVKKIGKHNVQ
jgi:hypothetical protein